MAAGEIFGNRVAAVRTAMKSKKLDVFISTFLPTMRYLCGFSGSNGLVIITGSTTILLTDFRYKEIIRSEVTADAKIIGKGNLLQVAAEKKLFSSHSRIGFEKDRITLSDLENAQKFISPKRLIAVSGIVEQLRMVKDSGEVRILRRAFDISDKVFQKILGIIKPGLTELELSAEISYYHKKYGAENDSFDVIVASGVRGSLPHGTASGKKINAGEFVTLDFGCICSGYHSDMTRTVAVGKPTREMKNVYAIVLEAQQKGCDAVRDGIAASTVDAAARKHIASKGYGSFFGHSLGHGVGLEIHELPRIAPKSKEILQTGNVVTIEPGIYLPKKFGIRIEDTAVVTQDGCEVLTNSPKELIVV